MIIKSKGMSIKAAQKLISYVMREEAQLSDERGNRLLIKQHLRGKTEEEWAREYAANEATRKYKNKRARGLYHCIISMHPKDSSNISLTVLSQIAKEFIRLRCPESLVLCTAHFDEHIHLHLVVSGVAYASGGKSIRIEKSEFKDILKHMSDFQEITFPELQFSKVDFGKGKGSKDNEYQMRLHGKVPEKQLATAYAQAAYESSSTFEEFCEAMKTQGFEPYERNGRIAGVRGLKKYRFTSLGIALDKFLGLQKSFSKAE